MAQWAVYAGPLYECPHCDFGDYYPRHHNCPKIYKTDRRSSNFKYNEIPEKSNPPPITAEQKKPTFNQTLFNDLKQELVTLTGGLDRQGRQLLVLQLKMQFVTFNKEKINSCLKFFMSLPECIKNKEGFTAVLDRISNKVDVELVVNCLRDVLKDKLKLILIVQLMDESNTLDEKLDYSVNDNDTKQKITDRDVPMSNQELTEKQKTIRDTCKTKSQLTEYNKTLTFFRHFCDNWDVYFDHKANRTVFKHTGTQSLSPTPPRFHRNIQQGLSKTHQEPSKTRNVTTGGESLQETADTSNDSDKMIKNNENSTTKHQAKPIVSTNQQTLMSNDSRAKVPVYIPLWKLGQYVSQDQLPPALCGTLEYNHEKWLNDRKHLTEFDLTFDRKTVARKNKIYHK